MPIPQYLAFPPEEYRVRTRKVQAVMAEKDLDALVCLNFPNIAYLTGVRTISSYSYFMLIVPRQGEPILFGSDFEMHNADINSWLSDDHKVRYVIGQSDPLEPTPLEGSKKLLQERGFANKRLGIEVNSHFLRAYDYLWFTQALPEATWVDASHTIEQVRAIKSPAEIAHLREAARLSTIGMQAAIDAVAEGVTDNALAAAAYEAMIGAGGEFMCIDPIVTVGERSGVPHSTHERARLQKGDGIFIEVGGCFQRYTAPIMRGVAVGPCPDLLQRMADACIASVSATIAGIKPGRAGHDVAFEAAKPVAEFVKAGFIWHGSHAYSTGMCFPPRWDDSPGVEIRLGNPTVLQPGMTFHATTSLRDPKKMGTCFSETVVVTESGCDVLTGVPRILVVK